MQQERNSMVPKVSVIIPVYNVEKFLSRCVNSVLNQTLKNLEIILVDDGSPDNSPQMCDEFKAQDTRIKVIHKTNGGLASARNAGLKIASAEYVFFLDSDDWLELDTLELCLAEIEKDPDIGCILFSYVKEMQSASIQMHIMDDSIHLIGKEAEDKVYRRLFGLSTYELKHPERMENMTSCCMKLYKVDHAKKGQYFDINEIGSCEDGLFNIYALYECKNMVYLDKHLYHYRKIKNSATNSFRPRLVEQWENLFSIMESIIAEKKLEQAYAEALTNRIALSITAIGLNELSNKDNSIFKHIRNIREYLKSEIYCNAIGKVSIEHMPLAWKTLMVACKCKSAFGVYMILNVINILRSRQMKGE